MRIADQKLNGVHRYPESVRRDDEDAGARTRSQILRAHLEFDRAIRMNRQVTIAGVAAASPGVK